ncbi:MAG: lysylphosphatidylglycerol synthase transmembrane domain-containing protein [Desulfobacteraceae bacterium]
MASRGATGWPGTKYLLGGVTFLLLTVAVFWFQFSRIEAGDQVLAWDKLHWRYFFLLLLFLPLDTVACGTRIWVVCRVLQPGIGFWTCLKAEWANVGVSMITPSSSGGGLGQIYMLNRGGADAGSAIAISFITFLGSMVGLSLIGLYNILFSSFSDMGLLLRTAVWGFTLIAVFVILAALWPGLFRVLIMWIYQAYWQIRGKNHRLGVFRSPPEAQAESSQAHMGRVAAKLVHMTHAYQDSVRKFVRLGRGSFVIVCLLSLGFLLSRCLMAFLCLRFLGIQASTLGGVMEIQMALILLVFLAPTPGGSGLAEGVSLSFMSSVVPVGFAPYYNLLWRFTTLYLAASVGLFFLFRTMVSDAHKVVARRRSRGTSIAL